MPSALESSPHFQLWKQHTASYPTNDRFVTFGWLFMISAALQRRVWIGSEMKAIFPNNYFLFVAPPGVGKSLITDDIRLMYELQTEAGIVGTDVGAANTGKLLFPISADSTSFESFVEFTAQSCRPYRFPKGEKPTYFYCSPAFILDEAASIFNKDAQNMATFLLQGWTCSRRYTRRTIGRGEDSIQNLCVNLVGGIQPGKLAELSKMAIVDNGFARRCIMIYGHENRFRRAFIEHHAGVSTNFAKLAKHVRSLAKLYGEVTITPEARAWMVEQFETNHTRIINKNKCLEHYYPSKHLHVQKLAMAIHFSDSTELVVGLDAFITAKALLDEIEPDMHYAYIGAKDVRGEAISAIKTSLRTAFVDMPDGLTRDELYPDLVDLLDYEAIGALLNDLVAGGILLVNNSGHYRLRQTHETKK